MSIDLAAYLGLFSAAFLAATLLPAQSEAVLAMMILADRYPLATLIGVASFGNVLGSVVNWMLGRGIEHIATVDGSRFRRKSSTRLRAGIGAMENGPCWQAGFRSSAIRSPSSRVCCGFRS